jgi:hypothetical protein
MAVMTPLQRVTCAVSVIVVGLVPMSASAASSHPAAKAAIRPDVGKWRVTGTELTGSVRVTAKHRAATGFTATIGPDADTACGIGKVTVRGKHKIIDAKGTDLEGDHYNDWVVGKNDPGTVVDVEPIKVTVTHDGHRQKGEFQLAFLNARGHSKQGDAAGEVIYGTCELQFDLRKR